MKEKNNNNKFIFYSNYSFFYFYLLFFFRGYNFIIYDIVFLKELLRSLIVFKGLLL